MKLLVVGTRQGSHWPRVYSTIMGINIENKRDLAMAIALALGCREDVPILVDCTASSLLTALRPAIMNAAITWDLA